MNDPYSFDEILTKSNPWTQKRVYKMIEVGYSTIELSKRFD